MVMQSKNKKTVQDSVTCCFSAYLHVQDLDLFKILMGTRGDLGGAGGKMGREKG